MSPLDRFIAPARPLAALWHTAFGVVLICGLTLVGMVALGMVLAPRFEAIAPSVATLLALLAFGILLLAALLVTRLWHRRPVGTLFGPGALDDFTRAVVPLLVVTGLFFALAFDDETLIPGLDPAVWLRLLPFACAALLIQVTAEEVIFRGYLLQQLGARFGTRWAWLVLPSVIFGALHYSPETYGSHALTVVAITTLYGLALADLTARAGNLGPAIALHFTNNFSAILLITLQEPEPLLGSLALYQQPMTDEIMRWMLVFDPLLTLIFWLIVRIRLRA